jgi:hypothetical protein
MLVYFTPLCIKTKSHVVLPAMHITRIMVERDNFWVIGIPQNCAPRSTKVDQVVEEARRTGQSK